MVQELEKIAVVHLLQQRAIISLIGNVRRSSLILEKVHSSTLFHRNHSRTNHVAHHHPKAFHVLRKSGVNVQMISQGASKVNRRTDPPAATPAHYGSS